MPNTVRFGLVTAWRCAVTPTISSRLVAERDHRRHRALAVARRDHRGHAVLQHGDAAVRRAQVDADHATHGFPAARCMLVVPRTEQALNQPRAFARRTLPRRPRALRGCRLRSRAPRDTRRCAASCVALGLELARATDAHPELGFGTFGRELARAGELGLGFGEAIRGQVLEARRERHLGVGDAPALGRASRPARSACARAADRLGAGPAADRVTRRGRLPRSRRIGARRFGGGLQRGCRRRMLGGGTTPARAARLRLGRGHSCANARLCAMNSSVAEPAHRRVVVLRVRVRMVALRHVEERAMDRPASAPSRHAEDLPPATSAAARRARVRVARWCPAAARTPPVRAPGVSPPARCCARPSACCRNAARDRRPRRLVSGARRGSTRDALEPAAGLASAASVSPIQAR